MRLVLGLTILLISNLSLGENLSQAFKRASYLLSEKFPSEEEHAEISDTKIYRTKVRSMLEADAFYEVLLRYHQRLLGIGLANEYLDELLSDKIDYKTNKFAKIVCRRRWNEDKLSCRWASEKEASKATSCPDSELSPVNVFWYKGVSAWVCPSLRESCGEDLSRCFIEYEDRGLAENSELGTTEAFDSRFAVIRSLSKQAAGLATAVVIADYPYTKILEPGLHAMDGAIAHLYKQGHHFDLLKIHVPEELLQIASSISLADTKFHLVYLDGSYENGGILSSFGWLRRYEKNRTRANQLYERLLCRKFTSELPRIFPADPGNLRTTDGCKGCHGTLDPLADFFKVWGEGGELYKGLSNTTETSFGGKTGIYLSDLAKIIQNDNAFSTCAVENAWKWLVGRGFYADEATLRTKLSAYFVALNFNFNELLFAIATHPVFLDARRSDALVSEPLSEPPLGEPPGGNEERPCSDQVTFTDDIEPKLNLCIGCHTSPARGGANVDLRTEDAWNEWGTQAVTFMASGQMPPSGGSGPPRVGPVFDLKEKVRCWNKNKG